ncbi:MAG TPA: restriction endonuclease [Candidatus Diapherotrites archaeon]|jgi:hypothetical protein|nr:restriction endonuclease [Candidatus Diapherotrites archaeon]
MDEKIKQYVNLSIKCMIDNASRTEKITKLKKTHKNKIHFIPIKYRIFNGLLQSLNIQFGNYIEKLMETIIRSDSRYEILEEYSGKKSNKFTLSRKTEELIDRYVTDRQIETNTNELDLEKKFEELIKQIVKNENDSDLELNRFKHDVDVIFKNKETGVIYYMEIKYNDDHDTDKFVSLNRKMIKTYAYLVRELKINDASKFVPLLFYFTNKRKLGNPYIPEQKNIYRGKRFFSDFLNIDYDKLDTYMREFSEEKDTIELFNNLYNKIVNE